jgi:N-methylhydantoinase B
MLAADLDSEVQACLMGARRMAELFERFGRETVEACFQAILDKCRDIFRRELLPKIADGEYRWEDYVEHDGVTDPKLHKLAITMIKRGDRITLDFTGTDPQSTGPINWPADYAGGAFLIKWIAPILRNLADTPERAAEIHVNEGVCEVFDVIFPPKGTLITPEWPAAPTRARSCCCAAWASLPASSPRRWTAACRGPGDHPLHRLSTARRERQAVPLPRGAGWRLGRALLRRRQRRHPYRARIRATSRPNSPRRDFRCWWKSSPCAWTPAAPASGAGASATRSITARWWTAAPSSLPIACGSAAMASMAARRGLPFCVTVDIEGAPRDLGGLVDGEPVLAGQVVRVLTTGGGGWGDALEREPELVQRDRDRGQSVAGSGARRLRRCPCAGRKRRLLHIGRTGDREPAGEASGPAPQGPADHRSWRRLRENAPRRGGAVDAFGLKAGTTVEEGTEWPSRSQRSN